LFNERKVDHFHPRQENGNGKINHQAHPLHKSGEKILKLFDGNTRSSFQTWSILFR